MTPRKRKGASGFGYGDDNIHQTVLTDMAGQYDTIFIRREFEIEKNVNMQNVGLVINYDDGFVVHLNGKEIFSKSIKQNQKGKRSVQQHEANGSEFFPLAEFAHLLILGENVIAIEGCNIRANSSDFTLDPYLVEVLNL